MASNRSCLFCSTTMCQRISIKDLYFSMNLGNLKYSSKNEALKICFVEMGRTREGFPFHNKVFWEKLNNILEATFYLSAEKFKIRTMKP